ncbi:hypothetical protein I317_05647 [Kwoniella heveanensis CBS 569]|uniref:Fumarylacetoacetase-like C-terminal domain-containing protein n=1 Tax=Kwoniella heveanensis BCC8398 TaxID=1296120 RepID=A0A1B9GSN0_9TREE|nr:hypothetical protein I316_04027 [Kwoniella heveanensis BCC8398]OCF40556.1 hypothetical protein I317_05647 [Kwoniella heveanensis CBS 569]
MNFAYTNQARRSSKTKIPSSMKYVSYRSKGNPRPIVGVLDPSSTTVTPLRFPDNSPVRSLHHLIEEWDKVWEHLIPGTPVENVTDVVILAPLRGRDVICVGKNYKDHAEEFHKSGYDSSDTKAQPEFPVFFTKRASSIIGNGASIYPHPEVTQSLDYEGELAIIIGRGGIGIRKEDAWNHVWGATIVNDVTARDRQRDHKQFFIGKSLDTFCPMGPWAVHSSVLDWKNLHLTTRLNGDVVQSQNTSELIFDIPTLISTLSMGITLQPGDVIATGTPVGVCLSTGVFLKDGDLVEVEITSIGTLKNKVLDRGRAPECAPVRQA